MTLTLHMHPLASFCHKVLIALYENGTPFEPHLLDLGNPDQKAAFLDIWPVGKMPILRDEARGETVPETSIIIEYLDRHYPGSVPLLPADEAQRLDARLWDRFFDLYVHAPMQAIVLRGRIVMTPRDPCGVANAEATLATAYGMIERRMAGRSWAAGEAFSIADCAAAPALFYSGIVAPFPPAHRNLAAYFERLLERSSFARVLKEARPYFGMFPYREKMPARFLEV